MRSEYGQAKNISRNSGLTVICFIIGLYAGGWAWYALTGYPDKLPSLMTLFDLGKISLTDKSKIMLPWAWAVTAVITFLPTGITLFIFLGAGIRGFGVYTVMHDLQIKES